MKPGSLVVTPSCKACGVLKGITNHWRIVWAGLVDGRKYFTATEYFEDDAKDPRVTFACGERCALVLFERWLGTGTLDAAPANSTEGDNLGNGK